MPGYRPGAVAKLAVMVIGEGPVASDHEPTSAAATTAAVTLTDERRIRMGMRLRTEPSPTRWPTA